MIDGMTKEMKAFCSSVKSFYKDELIYHKEYMPTKDSINQVYFPWCNHILDVAGLMAYLEAFTVTDELLYWLDISLFNKDKATIIGNLTT